MRASAVRVLCLRLPFRSVLLPVEAAQNVLPHRHIGKQGVILEQIPHPPLLRRQVDPFFRIKQRLPVQHDGSPVRPFDARDALQGHAFAAAGGPQQAQHTAPGLEPGGEAEIPQLFFNVHKKAHRFTAFRRSSSRFTASSTTVEIARFTSTQRKAPASSLVRHSWYTVVEMVAVFPGV